MDNRSNPNRPGRFVHEIHTDTVCIHPHYGFICKPNTTVDFNKAIPKVFGSHKTLAEIDQYGFRNKNVPAVKPENEFWIGWFGGSVALSVASSCNDTTIPAFLETKLNRWAESLSPKPSFRFRVMNYALPGGQQPATTHVFLEKSHLLNGIITFDGHNEIIVPAYYNHNLIPEHFPFSPYYSVLFSNPVSRQQIALAFLKNYFSRKYQSFSGTLKALLNIPFKKIQKKIKKRLNDLSKKQFEFKTLHPMEPKSREQRIKDGALRWFEYIKIMNSVCQTRNIEPLFVLEPIPEIGKSLTPEERSHIEEDYSKVRQSGYSLLQKHADELKAHNICCEELTHVFEKETEDIYTDIIHFQDKGCEIVAEAVFQLILKNWKLSPFRSGNAPTDNNL